MASIIIFTDLDGCLLDEDTYRWDAAGPALDAIRRARIPLVLASSKTRAEIVPLAHALGLARDGCLLDPLIIENGGAVLMPDHWVSEPPTAGAQTDDGRLIPLGAPVSVLSDALDALAAACGARVRSFAAMSDKEIRTRTGLSAEAVPPARQREFDVPFVLTDGREPLDAEDPAFEPIAACLQRSAEARGLRVTGGGRFLHLTGDTDKGRAAELVLRWYADRAGPGPLTESVSRPGPFSVALGDSPNDLALLRLVDQPIIVPQSNGRPHPELAKALPHATVAGCPGPGGWNRAVQALLDGL